MAAHANRDLLTSSDLYDSFAYNRPHLKEGFNTNILSGSMLLLTQKVLLALFPHPENSGFSVLPINVFASFTTAT